jgi:hypothetical protein
MEMVHKNQQEILAFSLQSSNQQKVIMHELINEFEMS